MGPLKKVLPLVGTVSVIWLVGLSEFFSSDGPQQQSNLLSYLVTGLGVVAVAIGSVFSYLAERKRRTEWTELYRINREQADRMMRAFRGEGVASANADARDLQLKTIEVTTPEWLVISKALREGKALAPRLTLSNSKRIERVPGSRLARLVAWLPGSAKSKSLVFGQAIADMREEYVEAVAAGNKRRQFLVRLRGYLSLAFALVAYTSSASLKRFVEIWKMV